MKRWRSAADRWIEPILEHFFLTIGQDNFGNKIPIFVHVLLWPERFTKLFEKVEDPKIGGSQGMLSKVVHTVMSNYKKLIPLELPLR